MKGEQSQRVTMIGLGGVGGRIAAAAIADPALQMDSYAADSDVHALCRMPRERRLRLGLALTGGLGTNGSAELGSAVAEHSAAEFTDVLKDSHVCLIAASLHGGLGSGGAPVVARAARSAGALAFALVPLASGASAIPDALATLAGASTATILFPAAADVLADQARLVVQVAGDIAAAFTTPCQGNSRAELLATLTGACSAGIGEAAGRGRAARAVDAALAAASLRGAAAHAEKLTALVATGGDLGLFELEEVVAQLRARLGSAVEPVTVAHADSRLRGEMRVVLLAADLPVEAILAPGQTVAKRTPRRERERKANLALRAGCAQHQLAPFPPERPTAAQRPLPLPIPIALAPPTDAPELPELLLSPIHVIRLAPETLRRHRRQPEQRRVSLADRIGLAGRQLRQGMRRRRPLPLAESGRSVRLVQQAQRLSG